ncbi:MAG: AMP-binding protein [Flavobacteriales bacterium]|nr:AMP-binding protein [Flavobacteriales bacterium]
MGPDLDPRLIRGSATHVEPVNFDRITVDGRTLEGDAIARYFDELVAAQRMDHAWAERLRSTAKDLMNDRGLPAKTSGTTGPPKEFTIPIPDLLASAELTRRAFDLRVGDRVLHCLPCEFIAGKLMLARAFALGLDIHFSDPRIGLLEGLHRTDRFAFTAMIPMQLHRMLQEDRARVEQQFATILLGGGPVSALLAEALIDLRTNVVLGYGSTETVTHVALRQLNGPQRSEHFTAIGDIHFSRDPRGCLVVYTPHLSTTQHVTNDLIELIDDTRFRWLGRFDNVILSGGKKVFPEQLEARTMDLLPYPHFFSGADDPVLGQAVVLSVESDRPQQEVVPEIMDLLLHTLHPHEMPRRIRVLPRIDRTGSGKIKRS